MRFLFVCTILFAACNSAPVATEVADKPATKNTADTAVTQQPSGKEPDIDAIRTEYGRINSLKLDSSGFSFLCDEQTKVALLKENGSVVKVTVDWGWVGDASTKEEWYYKAGQLFFRYVRTEGGVGDQPNTVHEARTYVKDNKVIRYLQDDREVPCNNCQIKPSAKEYAALKVSSNEAAKAALCR